MNWKATLHADNQTWRSVEDYARERITELTGQCTAVESTDTQIRQAQAGILELQRLISLPQMVAAERQARASTGVRKEY